MHLKTLIFFILILCITTTNIKSQSVTKYNLTYESNVYNYALNYTVYYPESYSKEINYPTLYLLHGIDGDETSWLKIVGLENILDSLIEKKAIPPVIVIFPDGQNSYYIDDHRGKSPFESVFIKEFIPYTDSLHSSFGSQELRAIAGASMGGFGAVLLPIKHPNLFGTSINISGAVRTPEQFKAISQSTYQNYFAPIFGDNLKGENRITEHWKENSPYLLVDSTNKKILQNINWYIDCGKQDFLFPANEALHQFFNDNNIQHIFSVLPGVHSWSYWRAGFIRSMVYWGELLE